MFAKQRMGPITITKRTKNLKTRLASEIGSHYLPWLRIFTIVKTPIHLTTEIIWLFTATILFLKH